MLVLAGALSSVLAIAADTPDAAQLDQAFQRSSLQIATPDARLHPFNIWIADTNERRARGLMFVRQLDADAGMLFIYPAAQPIAMWMKNTYIPLDMVFVDRKGVVTSVAHDTEPLSERTIPSNGPAWAVVELNAGAAAAIGLEAGDRVRHSIFGP